MMEHKNLKFLVDVGVGKKLEGWLFNQGYDGSRELGVRSFVRQAKLARSSWLRNQPGKV